MVGRLVLGDFPYLLMLIDICPGYWYKKFLRMNVRVGEDKKSK